MNTTITDAAASAAWDVIQEAGWTFSGEPFDDIHGDDKAVMRRVVEAVKQSLTAAPEAGNPVSVSERERFEAWMEKEFMWPDEVGPFNTERSGLGYVWNPAQFAWQGWQASRYPMVDQNEFISDIYIVAGTPGMTPIDLADWIRDVLLRNIYDLAARQPVGEVWCGACWQHGIDHSEGCIRDKRDEPAMGGRVSILEAACAPARQFDPVAAVAELFQYRNLAVTPIGYRWRHSVGEKWQYSDIPCGWESEPLYAAPPAQQSAQVDLGQFREAVQYAGRTCPHEDLASKLMELMALIDSQQESKP